MKKIFFVMILLPLLFSSCEKKEEKKEEEKKEENLRIIKKRITGRIIKKNIVLRVSKGKIIFSEKLTLKLEKIIHYQNKKYKIEETILTDYENLNILIKKYEEEGYENDIRALQTFPKRNKNGEIVFIKKEPAIYKDGVFVKSENNIISYYSYFDKIPILERVLSCILIIKLNLIENNFNKKISLPFSYPHEVLSGETEWEINYNNKGLSKKGAEKSAKILKDVEVYQDKKGYYLKISSKNY